MKWKKARKLKKMCLEKTCEGCKYDRGSTCEVAKHGYIPAGWERSCRMNEIDILKEALKMACEELCDERPCKAIWEEECDACGECFPPYFLFHAKIKIKLDRQEKLINQIKEKKDEMEKKEVENE